MFPFNLSREACDMAFVATHAVITVLMIFFAYMDMEATAGNESHFTDADIKLLADEVEDLERTLKPMRESNA